MKRLFPLGCLLIVFLFSLCQVHGQDEQYFRIYSLIQEADGFKNAQKPAAAYAKYLESQKLLLQFQRAYPDWNATVVKYRLTYLESALAEVTAKNPEVTLPAEFQPKTTGTSPAPSKTAEADGQLASLQNEVRQLQTDKASLEAKLREALRLQPAAADPQALARAEQEIKSLKKDNALLNVALTQSPSRTVATDAKAIEDLKRQLAEANRHSAEQAARADTLTSEKAELQKKIDSLIPSAWNATKIEAARKSLDETERRLAEQIELNSRLSLEQTALQNRVKTLMSESEAAVALRTENEILKKQLAEWKSAPTNSEAVSRELTEARAQIAVLKSDQNVLRLEKAALEKRFQQVSAPVPALSDVAARVKDLEQERDELRKKLTAAEEELAAHWSKPSAGRVEVLTGEVEVLRTRLAVLETQRIPYTEEELALFQKPAPQVADPKAGKKSSRDLPAGSLTLVAEAQKDFAARRYDRAEEKYQQVLKQDDKNVYTLANLAAIQLELNHLDDAEKNVRQALELAPADAYALSVLGFLKFRQGKFDDALDTLGHAAKLDPQNAEIQNYLGLTLSQKGMRKAAESALRKAIALDSNYGSAHYNLAVIYVTQKPADPALAYFHYQKALAAGVPANPEVERMIRKPLDVVP